MKNLLLMLVILISFPMVAAAQNTQRQAMREANQAKRQTGEGNNPSKEERFAMQNKRLDNQIAMKAKMKDILTEDQFVKWEKTQIQRKNDFNQNKPNRKNRGNK
jgi:F0F1-type ATP synthase assembly protein I